MDIPNPAFLALGAVLAALIAGFFSVLSLVASKENKVSEFRLAWIDGLRDEIAAYTVGVQELVRLHGLLTSIDDPHLDDDVRFNRELEWGKAASVAYERAVGSLSKILLRLNPKHAASPTRPEHILREAVLEAQKRFNDDDWDGAYDCCQAIREKAAPLLKSTWDMVKKGEIAYRMVRGGAITAVVIAATSFGAMVVLAWIRLAPAQ